jgi:hypothetical protein
MGVTYSKMAAAVNLNTAPKLPELLVLAWYTYI